MTLVDDYHRCSLALHAAILCDDQAKISTLDSRISEVFEEILAFNVVNSVVAKQLVEFLLERLSPLEERSPLDFKIIEKITGMSAFESSN